MGMGMGMGMVDVALPLPAYSAAMQLLVLGTSLVEPPRAQVQFGALSINEHEHHAKCH